MSDKEEKKDEKKNEEKDKEDKKDETFEKPSYTFWKRDSDLQADHKGFQPQQVDNKAKQPEETNNSNNNQLGSAWNKAATWEEKNVTKKQFEDFFNSYVEKNKKEYNKTFIIDSFSDYSGDTYFVFSRGKVKYFYDCKVKAKIRGIGDNNKRYIYVTINEMNNEDEDEHFNFEYDSSDKDDMLAKNCKVCERQIEKDIRNIFNELKSFMINK